MMTEVGGKLKAGLLVASVALFGVLAFSARTADIVKIKGEACEKFVPGQSKSSIRVRVTDKASYKAVSQVENLADVRSRMLEHDFNVIVYNLVDNYVRDLMVRTTSQNDKELCVKVTGALLASDIDTVVANYSPNTPAPEYDIKEAAGIEEEVLTEEDELEPAVPAEPDAEVLYSGPEELEQERQERKRPPPRTTRCPKTKKCRWANCLRRRPKRRKRSKRMPLQTKHGRRRKSNRKCRRRRRRR